MRIFRQHWLITACIAAAALGGLVLAMHFGPSGLEADWFSIAGGGNVSTGGDLEISGTIGQADTAIMRGGDLEIQGGYWPAAGPDCNNNGVPDEVDIALCTPQSAEYPGCDDCNLNRVPDECDIGAGLPDLELPFGVPDECVTAAAGNWSDDIWNLTAPDPYPDNLNPSAVPNLNVTLPDGVSLLLDVTVEVDSLRLIEGSTLRVTDTGDGDLSMPASGNLQIGGELLVAHDRVIDVGGDVLISGGIYHKDIALGPAMAELSTTNLTIVSCEPCTQSGSLDLDDDMTVTVNGNLTIDARLATNAVCGQSAVAGGYTPPIRSVRNSLIHVVQNMSLIGSAEIVMSPTVPLTPSVIIEGDFINESSRPDCFQCRNGGFLLDGTSQFFEVAGTDVGQIGSVDSAEFVVGAVEVAPGAQVTFRNDFDNNALGQASCEEALYVQKLTLQPGASIIADNCRVYYETLGPPNATATIIGCGALLSVVSPSAPPPPGPDPSGINKGRAISIVPPASITAAMGGSSAIRVTLSSLHHVDPPYTGGTSIPFTSFQGQVRWVGPPAQYVESTSTGTPFMASNLQCTPYYQDWSTVGLLHIFGSAIVPSSSYRVQIAAASCEGIEDFCTAVSAPLTVNTTRWGDVVTPYNPPSTTVQPDLGDVGALVNKFRSAPGAPIKARALLAGDDAFGNINTLGLDLGFGHIAACVDAFRGKPYPFTIQSCP